MNTTGDFIVISTASRNGKWRLKLHSFYWSRYNEWVVVPTLTTKQKRAYGRTQSRPSPGDGVRFPLGDQHYDRLRDYTTPVHLADGIDPSASALEVMLNALRSGQRPEVDLADLKAVVWELGGYIKKLDGLPADTRQHAEQALYTEVLDRCTLVNQSRL
jgi:hypothetical protein